MANHSLRRLCQRKEMDGLGKLRGGKDSARMIRAEVLNQLLGQKCLGGPVNFVQTLARKRVTFFNGRVIKLFPGIMHSQPVHYSA